MTCLKGVTFSKQPFWVSMLVFGRIYTYNFLLWEISRYTGVNGSKLPPSFCSFLLSAPGCTTFGELGACIGAPHHPWESRWYQGIDPLMKSVAAGCCCIQIHRNWDWKITRIHDPLSFFISKMIENIFGLHRYFERRSKSKSFHQACTWTPQQYKKNKNLHSRRNQFHPQNFRS